MTDRATDAVNRSSSLAILGTGSDVGKSTIAAGICRILANHNVCVAPFKAQNMSNNAQPALMEDGGWGEIGTAQAIQAEACRIPPRVEMNPVLLKSGGRRESDGAYLCSVIVLGKPLATEDYGDLGQRTAQLKDLVMDAHKRLSQITSADAIILEGAGSCTELNLKDRDIVNLPLVRELNCPWLLVANIDPGGVFAQVVGTKACVTEQDWGRCCGVVINRLRGEAKYFEPGPAILEELVGKKIFVVPHLYDLNLPEEDGLGVERRLEDEWRLASGSPSIPTSTSLTGPAKPLVVVVAYPHVAITSDMTPLEADTDFIVQWRRKVVPTKGFADIAAVILPGSRLTRSDLEWLKQTEWANFLHDYVEQGGVVLGLCGGYQMLGSRVSDRHGVEGDAGTTDGLAFLPIETDIAPAQCKVVAPRKGILRTKENGGHIRVEGFELHCGRTQRTDATKIHTSGQSLVAQPLLTLTDCHGSDNNASVEEEGLRLGNVCGTHLHGVLRSRKARRFLLLGETKDCLDSFSDTSQDDPIDTFAKHLIDCGLDFDTISSMFERSL